LLLFFHPRLLPLCRLLVEQGLDADAPGLRTEVSTQSVRASEASAAAPLVAALERALTDELLLSAVQAFVTFAVVLSRESFAADSTDEWSLVSVSAEMRAQIVCTCETFGTEAALECGGMLLHSPVIVLEATRRRSLRLSQIENVVTLIGCVARASSTA
jgi:hypothetical protein